MRLGGDTGETGGELAGIVWEEMGWMGVGVLGAVQGAGRPQARRGGSTAAGERSSPEPPGGRRPAAGKMQEQELRTCVK